MALHIEREPDDRLAKLNADPVGYFKEANQAAERQMQAAEERLKPHFGLTDNEKRAKPVT